MTIEERLRKLEHQVSRLCELIISPLKRKKLPPDAVSAIRRVNASKARADKQAGGGGRGRVSSHDVQEKLKRDHERMKGGGKS
jgi:uncharacterized protein (DUF342 family)